MAIDTTSLASLLDALKAWLQANPNGDLSEFAAEHGCTVEDVSDAWNTYFTADFSRDYDLNTTQGGSQGAVHYSPAPPPHSASPAEYKQYLTQEINNYQQFTTINNIEDNSFNQQIIGSNVNQDIDIDNSDNVVGEDGVLIRDSNLDDTNVNTGDRAVQDSEEVLTGDVTTQAGDGAQAQTGIEFGEGDLQQNQQDQDVEINKTGDNDASGGSADGTGGAGTGTGGGGGTGGDADADATGGTGAGGIL
ncbi:MAG: hypothetical protein ACRDRK_24125, partial [Pseudonocardia sp.]